MTKAGAKDTDDTFSSIRSAEPSLNLLFHSAAHFLSKLHFGQYMMVHPLVPHTWHLHDCLRRQNSVWENCIKDINQICLDACMWNEKSLVSNSVTSVLNEGFGWSLIPSNKNCLFNLLGLGYLLLFASCKNNCLAVSHLSIKNKNRTKIVTENKNKMK